MNNDGTIDLASGIAEIGQGSATGLAQIAAEELGIDLKDVNIITGDTSATPQCLGAWGSRQIFIAGNAVKMAAGEIRQKLLEEASRMLEARVDDLVAKERKVYVKGSPGASVSIAQVATTCYNRGRILAGRGCYDDPTTYLPDKKTGYGGIPTYAFGTDAVEVEVDRVTGRVKILSFVAVHDVGKLINPMMAEGQIEGAVLQGIGYALSEELVWEEGVVLNPNFQDYRILYINNVPRIKTIMVESIDPDGPYGAKGLAEAGSVPTAAAIANAIYDAVGVRIKSLPITPEKILKALKEKE
jgi:CO/xanthine dehydrogenase Mo-binding subunit